MESRVSRLGSITCQIYCKIKNNRVIQSGIKLRRDVKMLNTAEERSYMLSDRDDNVTDVN